MVEYVEDIGWSVQDPDAEDAAQIVRTLSVHRHCGSSVRVIVELLKPERAASAIWDDTEQGIEIMCLDVIRFKLLARRSLSNAFFISPILLQESWIRVEHNQCPLRHTLILEK